MYVHTQAQVHRSYEGRSPNNHPGIRGSYLYCFRHGVEEAAPSAHLFLYSRMSRRETRTTIRLFDYVLEVLWGTRYVSVDLQERLGILDRQENIEKSKNPIFNIPLQAPFG